MNPADGLEDRRLTQEITRLERSLVELESSENDTSEDDEEDEWVTLDAEMYIAFQKAFCTGKIKELNKFVENFTSTKYVSFFRLAMAIGVPKSPFLGVQPLEVSQDVVDGMVSDMID